MILLSLVLLSKLTAKTSSMYMICTASSQHACSTPTTRPPRHTRHHSDIVVFITYLDVRLRKIILSSLYTCITFRRWFYLCILRPRCNLFIKDVVELNHILPLNKSIHPVFDLYIMNAGVFILRIKWWAPNKEWQPTSIKSYTNSFWFLKKHHIQSYFESAH